MRFFWLIFVIITFNSSASYAQEIIVDASTGLLIPPLYTLPIVLLDVPEIPTYVPAPKDCVQAVTLLTGEKTRCDGRLLPPARLYTLIEQERRQGLMLDAVRASEERSESDRTYAEQHYATAFTLAVNLIEAKAIETARADKAEMKLQKSRRRGPGVFFAGVGVGAVLVGVLTGVIVLGTR